MRMTGQGRPPRRPEGSGLQEWILFLAGLAGVAHETLVQEFDRPSLIAVFAVMMGLPFFRGKGPG